MAPNTFREATRMADERPLNLAQFIVDYFDIKQRQRVRVH
ncbi:hypothetical protein AWV72_02125 [Lactiplantibacillus plantarum]|nr:hypothetical protein AWV72_02125 [Lactiplantibacillus plantarum]KZU52749.1 hypothetical protein Nizo2801_2042 [Lactiplantibacillus plantarum]